MSKEAGATTTDNHVLSIFLRQASCNVVSLAKGARIETKPSKLYMVVSGVVIIGEGGGYLCQIRKPKEIFGCESLINVPTDESIGVRALENAAIAHCEASKIKEMIRAGNNGICALVEALAANPQLEEATSSIASKVAKILLKISDDFGKTDESGTIVIRQSWLIQEEIALMVGTTREVVSHAMNAMRKQGIVTYRRGEIKIVQLEIFKQIAAGTMKIPGKKKEKE